MTARRIADRFLIAAFVLSLAGYAIASLARPADVAALAREGRRPNSLPTRPIKLFPENFERFFNDRLAGREHLVGWHARAKVDGLGVSPTEKVLLGHDGWLFLDEEKFFKSQGPCRTPDEQVRLWHAAVHRRYDWCAARGISYLLVLTPEKHRVYPEFLPDEQRHSAPPTPAERLAAALRAEGVVRLLDLRGPLLAAKGDRPLYFLTDTHWNYEGGYVAYRALADALGERPLERADFTATPAALGGDLGRMLRRPELPPEPYLYLAVARPRVCRSNQLVGLDAATHWQPTIPPEAFGRAGGRLRVVLFHDSFSTIVLIPALIEHCECLVSLPSPSFDPRAVEPFRPTVVIQQIVERKINWEVPSQPAGFVP